MLEGVLIRPLSNFLNKKSVVARCHEKDPPHPPPHNWHFAGHGNAFDVRAIRRGYEVYKGVCATCHCLNSLAYSHFIDQVYPEGKVKVEAGAHEREDGPNDQGEMFMRPCSHIDNVPPPYPNKDAAMYANGGAAPPDLSYIMRNRHGNGDYLFALMIGYRDPPVGVEMRAGLYYNIYFPGGAIGMPPPLENGAMDYEDGTPACVSQMASDLVHFLTWAARPGKENSKLLSLKFVFLIVGAFGGLYWWRVTAAHMKTVRYDFVTPKL